MIMLISGVYILLFFSSFSILNSHFSSPSLSCFTLASFICIFFSLLVFLYIASFIFMTFFERLRDKLYNVSVISFLSSIFFLILFRFLHSSSLAVPHSFIMVSFLATTTAKRKGNKKTDEKGGISNQPSVKV